VTVLIIIYGVNCLVATWCTWRFWRMLQTAGENLLEATKLRQQALEMTLQASTLISEALTVLEMLHRPRFVAVKGRSREN
jgi:magnesium-transporting ATPase (P-type)